MKRLFSSMFVLGLCLFTLVGNVWSAPILYNGHYYELTSSTGTWGWCENEAVLKGGHLVTINDSTEESWLQSQFGRAYLWIGFTDQAAEGTWVWISGEPVTYTNWAGGEPNNAGGEDYAVMNWSGIKWNDLNGSQPYYGIIETAPVPLPSALLLFAPGLAGLAALRRKFRHS
ncbi:MAG: Lectin C-type domain protein [Syntrophus sp. PtaU1.Bin208]|nr:MAG: Lectin C-type domain protein [Syntrophus sp. PtaU1.Bin208]